jgi:hypothetical protein
VVRCAARHLSIAQLTETAARAARAGRLRERCIWADSPKCSVIDSKIIERALRDKPVPAFSRAAL